MNTLSTHSEPPLALVSGPGAVGHRAAAPVAHSIGTMSLCSVCSGPTSVAEIGEELTG